MEIQGNISFDLDLVIMIGILSQMLFPLGNLLHYGTFNGDINGLSSCTKNVGERIQYFSDLFSLFFVISECFRSTFFFFKSDVLQCCS